MFSFLPFLTAIKTEIVIDKKNIKNTNLVMTKDDTKFFFEKSPYKDKV